MQCVDAEECRAHTNITSYPHRDQDYKYNHFPVLPYSETQISLPFGLDQV